MKTLQIDSSSEDNRKILRAAGVRRVHPGWYTVGFRGPALDRSTVCAAKRNPKGAIRY